MSGEAETVPVAAAIENLAIANEGNDDFVDPWNVASASDTGIDYDKLISMCYS